MTDKPVDQIKKLLHENDFSLEEAAEILEMARIAFLFNGDDDNVMDTTTFAVQYYLSAIAKIEDAQHTMKLASLYFAREMAGNL